MKFLRLTAWTVWFMLSWVALAHADPVSALIGAIGTILKAGGIGAMLIKAAFGIALQIGGSLLQKAMAKKQPQPGINGQLQVGGNNSFSFIVGTYATAGSLDYYNEVGLPANKTPNNTAIQVVTVSDLPVTSIGNRAWINGELCNRNPSATIPGDNGGWLGAQSFPFEEYKSGAYYFLFARYFLGQQTVVYDKLVDLFGSDPDRPWQIDMVGRGTAYVVLSSYVNRELFTSLPVARWEVEGIPLYDPRKDSTVGGSGSQRWGQPATYAFSDNPAVIAYNLLRGIYYEGELIYGPAVPATSLPLANWIAAMNECDIPVALDGGGTEKQFRAGYEIKVAEHEPIDVIKELLKSCNGQIAENGGVYKIHVGAPALPSMFVTDEDFVVTEEQEYDPFPPLEQTFNGATASYPDPDASWEMKDAPQRRFPDLEVEDDGRILLADFQFNAVPFPTQVQRLMKSMVLDGRKFRKNRGTLPPAAFALEPLDTISWTSARNGYVGKLFPIESMDDLPNANQAVAIKEADPSDYDWTPNTDQLPWSVGPLVPKWPAPQEMTGWAVAPYTIKDNAGNNRRPAIQVFYQGNLEDVRAVRVWVRLDNGDVMQFDGEHPYGDPRTNANPASAIISFPGILPDTDYEVQGEFVPYSGRSTSPSAWLPVKTDDIRLGDEDVYLPGMVDEINQHTEEMLEPLRNIDVRQMYEDMRANALAAMMQDGGQYSDVQRSVTQLRSVYDNVTADYQSLVEAKTGPDSTLVRRLDTLDATIPGLATVSALSATTARVTNLEGTTTAYGGRLDLIEVALPQKADASALSSLSVTVSNQGNTLTSQGNAITGLQTSIAGKADASALSSLSTTVSNQGNTLSAQGTAITGVQADVGKFSAGGFFRTKAVATESGAQSTIGIYASASSGEGTTREAAILLSAIAGNKSMVGIVADLFYVTDNAGNKQYPFVFAGGIAYANQLRVDFAKITNVEITGSLIVAGSIDSPSLALKAVTDSKSDSSPNTSYNITAPSYVDVLSVTLNNLAGNPVSISLWYSTSYTNSANVIRLVRGSTVLSDWSRNYDGGGNAVFGPTMAFDPDAPSGSVTYKLQMMVGQLAPGGRTTALAARMTAMIFKR